MQRTGTHTLKRRRTPLALLMTLGLMASLLMVPASASVDNDTIPWTGQGDRSENCEKYEQGEIHWIFQPGAQGNVTAATLYVPDEDPEPMSPQGNHFDAYTGFGEAVVEGGVISWPGDQPYVKYEGQLGRNPRLLISGFCDDPRVEPEGTVVVEKTVDTSFERTHDWSIDKSVDPHQIKLWIPGQEDKPSSGTARWDVDVTYEGYEDSDITVSGTITVSVSGDADARIDDVTDLVAQNGVGTPATVACEDEFDEDLLPATLSPGESLECTYTATLDSIADGTNTATAEGEFLFEDLDPDVYLPKDNDPFTEHSDAEPVVFGAPDPEHHKSVDVEDLSDLFEELGFAEPELLGTLDADDFNEGESENFWYDLEFDWFDYATNSDAQEGCTPPGEYHEYDNTASVIGDGETVLDSAGAQLQVKVQCWVPDPDFNGWTNDE